MYPQFLIEIQSSPTLSRQDIVVHNLHLNYYRSNNFYLSQTDNSYRMNTSGISSCGAEIVNPGVN